MLADESDSFLGNIILPEALTGALKVVKELYSSSKGPFRILLAERMGKRMILKCLKEDCSDDPQYKLMLRKEFDLGYSLSHPGIATTLEYTDQLDLGECIIEEYVAGKSLDKILKEGELTYDEAVKIISKLIKAVKYIHDQQIVHGDLKPSNIIISEFDGSPKIIDFGFADSPMYENLKFHGGTEPYIAPERKECDYRPDARSDIWSLGIIIEKISESLKDKRNKRLKRLAELCKKPIDQRIQTADELSTLLNERVNADHKKYMLPVVALLVLAALFIFSYLIIEYRSNILPSAENDKSIVDSTSAKQTQISENVTASEKKASDEKLIEQNVSGDGMQVGNQKSPVPVADETKEIKNDVDYYKQAMDYAVKHTNEIQTKLKESGNYISSPTVAQYFNVRHYQGEILNDIKEYVGRMPISSVTEKEKIIDKALQKAREIIDNDDKKIGFKPPG